MKKKMRKKQIQKTYPQLIKAFKIHAELFFMEIKTEEQIIEDLKRKLEEAEKDAVNQGVIIGRITRYKTVKIGEEELIGVDIAFEDYLKSPIARGQYLAIRGITRPIIMVGQVYSIDRADILSRLGLRELTYPKDPTTIITDTYIELKPIAEFDEEKNLVRPAVSPIDPQSPVFIPKAELLEKVLRIPEKGVVVGNIFSGGEEIDAKVRLDEETLKHHTLILGTTGSGKTTLLKSVISSRDIEKKTLVFDRQRDFVNFLIGKGERFAVLMPVSEKVNRKISIKDHVEDFANWYECSIEDVKPEGGQVKCREARVLVVPYSINFFDNFETFNRITPYFTSRASMHWDAIVSKTIESLLADLRDLLGNPVSEDTLSILLREKLTPKYLTTQGGKVEVLQSETPFQQVKTMAKSHASFDVKKGTFVVYVGKAFHEAMESLDLAYGTKEAIIRTLKTYDSYGIFTVPGTIDFNPESLFSRYDKIVVDLSWVMETSASIEAVATIAYKILEEFFAWKDWLYKRKEENPLTLVIMDEAHEYFPQTTQENVSKDIVEGLINRIMRLGRVRNIGVILATHMPDDLNPLVLQLSNTKIVMRNDVHVLRSLGMEKYQDFLLRATPGLAIINSIYFNEIPMKTRLPQ